VDLLGREGMSLDPQRVSDYKNAMVSCLKMHEPNTEALIISYQMFNITFRLQRSLHK